MGEQVYEQPFEVIPCAPEDVPPTHETGKALGRHLDGCRIGFDLGASDRKVSAVIDGQVVYSEEVIWEPRKHSDPEYHYPRDHGRAEDRRLQNAARGCHRRQFGRASIIDNRPMVASLFRGIPARALRRDQQPVPAHPRMS